MIYQVFAVKDAKAAAFAPPFFLHRMEVALRGFRDAVKDPQHQMHAHPEDYALYCLGEFDDATGELMGVNEPVLVAQALDPANRPPTPVSDELASSLLRKVGGV